MTNSTNTKKEKKSIFKGQCISLNYAFQFCVILGISWIIITLFHILDGHYSSLLFDLAIIVFSFIYGHYYYKLMKAEEAEKK